MQEVVAYIFLFVIAEYFEATWQRASTLEGILENIHTYYKKSVFLVLFLHPTFFLAVYFMLITDTNFYLSILFGIKSADIALKLVLVENLFERKKLSADFLAMLSIKIEPYMLYIGMAVYPVFIFLGFV